MKQTIKQAAELIKSDFIKRCEYENKTPSMVQAIKFLFYPAFASVLLYRLQYFLASNNWSWPAAVIKNINEVIFSISIDSSAQIGARLMILHASFIAIGPMVKIGHDFIAVHNNSILPSPFNTDTSDYQAPVIGNNVILGGGAQVTGPVIIGDHVQVSMNASVEDSFADHAVVFGVPGRNLQKKDS